MGRRHRIGAAGVPEARLRLQGKLQDFPSMTIACYQLRPESLGSIHIRSADPKAHPAIRFNFLADRIDQDAMTAGFRMMRRIVDAKPMDAYRDSEFSPGPSVNTDDEILASLRQAALAGGAADHQPGHAAVQQVRGQAPERGKVDGARTERRDDRDPDTLKR